MLDFSVRQLHRFGQQQQYGMPGPGTQTAPLADPQLQTGAALHSFAKTMRPVLGVITDTAAVAHCYRVQLEKLRCPMVAMYSPHTSCGAFGARDLTTLQPGTHVVVLVHDHLPYGIIVGTLPPPGTAARLATSDMISQASRQRADDAHQLPLRLHANGAVVDWTAGRPFDSTTAGEAGWITETGVKITIDPFMVQLAVDEMTGVFGFYHDQLLRIAGYNLQLWTAGSERDAVNDQEEYDDVTGFTPYPWENLGLFGRDDPLKEQDAKDWQQESKHYAKWEPKEDKQQPWHRTRLFHGYLGQAGKLLVQVEPKTPPEVFEYDDEDLKFPGVFDQHTGLDGAFSLQSAKRISIVKRAPIISPKRLKRPEDPQGDTEANYKASGKVGDGPDHHITGDIAASHADRHIQRAAGVLDMHAYIFNYAGLHPFFWHHKDWAIPQEKDLDHLSNIPWRIRPLGELAGQMYLTPVDPIRFKVDHRYGEQDYYQTECGIDLLEDGGVVLYDGYGGEIRMTAGHLFLTAPGDVWLQAGRNVNSLSGWDSIIKAKNSMDLTATARDVRIKAQRNMQLLAGNGEEGGILLESLAPYSIFDFTDCGEKVRSAGVMIKTPRSEFCAWSKHVYLRTGGGDVASGVITLDSNRGGNDVITHAQNVVDHVKSTVQHFITSEGDVQTAYEFKAGNATFDSQLCVNGKQTLNGSLDMIGSIRIAGGHIYTEQARSHQCEDISCYSVGWLRDPRPVYDAVERCENYAHVKLHQIGERHYLVNITVLWYMPDRPGNDGIIDAADMSMRTVDQYHTEDFRLFETRWQQIGRISGTLTATWGENPLDCHGIATYPYPGQQNYEADTLYTQDFEIFELRGTVGNSLNRGKDGSLASPYLKPKYGEPVATNLGGYLVVR